MKFSLRGKVLPVFIRTFLAAQISAIVGSFLYTLFVVLADVMEPDFSVGEMLSASSLFISILVVALVLVNVIALVVAFPLRLLVGDRLPAVLEIAISCLLGGLLYAGPYAYSLLPTLSHGDGGRVIAFDDYAVGLATLFSIGALFGGIFGIAYAWLRRFPRETAAQS